MELTLDCHILTNFFSFQTEMFVNLFYGAKLSVYVKFSVVLCGREMRLLLTTTCVVDFIKLTSEIRQSTKRNSRTSEEKFQSFILGKQKIRQKPSVSLYYKLILSSPRLCVLFIKSILVSGVSCF